MCKPSELGVDLQCGVIFEIGTPEGLNVQSMSEFTHDQEVILPRGAKYVVVGQYDAEFAYIGMNAPPKKVPVVQLIAVNDELLDGTNYQASPAPTKRNPLTA